MIQPARRQQATPIQWFQRELLLHTRAPQEADAAPAAAEPASEAEPSGQAAEDHEEV